MTRGNIREYTKPMQGRYFRASKKERGRILGDFTNITGYHRKAAIRLLRYRNLPGVNRKACEGL